MACVLTQGVPIDCRDSMGGAKSFHLIAFADVTTVTSALGVVTAIVKATGKRFWKYVPAKETSYLKETITSSVQNGTIYYAQEIMMALTKMQANLRNEIMILGQVRIMAIVTDANNKPWLVGSDNGLDLTAGEGGTGTAPGDRNGYSVTFTGNEPLMALEVDAATYLTLETPGT